MTDGLDYIREEIAKFGKKASVEVVRWEIDVRTGDQNIPVKISVNANVALKELSKPMNKRSYIWSRIRPLGIEPFKNPGIAEGSLEDPILRSKLKDALRDEILAELKGTADTGLNSEEVTEAPKKKKKKLEITDESDSQATGESTWVDPTISNDPYLA